MPSSGAIKMAIILAATDKMSRTVDRAFSKVNAKLDATQKRADQIAKSSASFGRDALAMGAGLGASLALPVKIGMDFEAQMSRVGAVARASDSELAEMTKTARLMGSTTQFSALEAAEGMQFLAMAGFDVQKTQSALPSVLNLAAAGAVDLGEAADISSNILSAFNLEAEQLAGVNDILAKAFTSSNTDLSMLGQTMKYVAPIANTLGADVADVAGMAGKLGDAGIKADQAGTSLRMMFLRLSAPLRKGEKALSSIGVTTKDAEGNLRPMAGILADIGKATKNLPTAKAAEVLKNIFGTEAVSAADILTRKAATGELQAYTASLVDQGAASRVASKMMENQRGAMLLAQSAAVELALKISDVLAPTVTDMFDKVAKVAGVIGKWAEKNPELTKTIVMGTAALSAMLIATGAGALVVAGIAKAVSMAAIAFKGAAAAAAILAKGMGLLNIVMTANPIGAVVVGAAALAAGIYLLWQRSEKFRGTIMGVWEVLKKVGDIIKNTVMKQAQGLGNVLAGIYNRDFGQIKLGVSQSVSSVPAAISETANANFGERFRQGYNEGAYQVGGTQANFIARPRSTIEQGQGRASSTAVEFAPTINVQGGTMMGPDDFRRMMKGYEPELVRVVEGAQRRENRKKF